MKEHEDGYIVVETVMAFTLYLFAVLSILTLINVVVVQSRVHYAITEACETISMYSYLLEVNGDAEHLMKQEEVADGVDARLQGTVDNINGIVDGALDFDGDAISNGIDGVQDSWDGFNPKVELSNFALQRGKNFAFAKLMEILSLHYLNNGIGDDGVSRQKGEDFLSGFGVEDGLHFWGTYGMGINELHLEVQTGGDGSKFLDADGNIVISVNYTVQYQFGTLNLPFDALEIHQVVKTKAWLGGEGEGYDNG